MSWRTVFLKWFAIGAVVAVFLVWTQAAAVGGLSGMIQVGETSDLRPFIEAELGEVPLSRGNGHDGQIYYAMGLDLAGDEVPELLDHGGYRYRRILFPLVSSAGGLLGGEALLWGMVVVAVAGTGIAAGVVAALARHHGRSEWFALAVLLNPGIWLSVRLLTADTLAIATMTLGLLVFIVARPRAWLWFSLSVLSKDVYLATPGALALSRDRRRWSLVLIPLAVLAAWMSWVTFAIGDGFTGRGNLAWPFTGFAESWNNWSGLAGDDLAYLGFALASVLAGLVYGAWAGGRLRWSILAWSVLGVISSNWVWDFGNNAARVFAPIVVLIAVDFVTRSGGTLDAETRTV
jgi:hypothetical protein